MLTVDNPSKFDWAGISLSDCCEGNAMDSYFTLKLYYLIEGKLKDKPVWNLIENVISPSLELFSEMEYVGLDVDLKALTQVGRQLNNSNMEEEDNLYNNPYVNKEDNLASNADLVNILYLDEDGFALYPPDRTGKGAPSVSAPTLKLLLEHIDEELESRG